MRESEEILREIVSYIDKNMTTKLTVEGIAALFYISQTYLQCLFKEHYGMPLAEYVRKQRMKRSMELLNTGKHVNDIAYDVGFEHESSFIRSFKREFGMTPGEARRKMQREKAVCQNNNSLG